MKIVLSRKGFDASAGGVPSPIFPDGTMYSLPIPETGYREHRTCYADITGNGQSIGGLVSDLTGGKFTGEHFAHLDPDLRAESISREAGWKPIFGQDGAAERHLQRHGVGPGDLFLYFGWFRRVEQVGGCYRYVRSAPDLHVIFGWLQVERRIRSDDKRALPTWAASHPHYLRAKSGTLDSIYTSTDVLNVSNIGGDVVGGGVFGTFDPRLCLTQHGKTRSLWQLPLCFDPEGKEFTLSYHGNRARWTRCDGYVTLQSVGRGQEFVISCDEYPEAIDWLATLFNSYGAGESMAKLPLRNVTFVSIGVIIGLLLPVAWATLTSQAQTGGCQTFPQTGHRVCGKFLQYWQQHGGLAQQGYPISEEFVETSELNGRPYTVQYFERAVFEMHPENRPPYDVLLSQLGTYQGRRIYTQGFPTAAGETPFYEERTSAVGALKSYYNAINRREFQRAYGYFEGAPNPVPSLAPPYDRFVAGYADTVSVTLALGIDNVTTGAAAGSIYASIPTAITARHRDGSNHLFVGCYTLRRANEGVSPDPADELWRIYTASLREVPTNTAIYPPLAQPCGP